MSTNGNMEFDLFNNIQNDAEIKTEVTEEPHVAFVKKCLHPPSCVGGYVGLPTNDTRSQAVIQWKNLNLMVTPAINDTSVTPPVVRSVVPADLTTFNYALIQPSGANVLSIPFIYNQTQQVMTQDVANVDFQDNYDFTYWKLDANLYRPNYKSLTTYLNATAFNDTGSVVGSQFNPNILFGGSILSLASENYNLFKSFVRKSMQLGSIEHISSKHLEYEKHRNVFNQFPKFVRDDILETAGFMEQPSTEDFAFWDSVYNLDPNLYIQIVSFGKTLTGEPEINQVIPTQSQILNNSDRSYGGRARDGTFSIQRLNTISPAWLSASNTGIGTGENPSFGLYQCWYHFIDSVGADTLVPFYRNIPIGTAAQNYYKFQLFDTLWSKDLTWSIIRYDGLSLNSQTSVNTQLLIKKWYAGYEVQPCFRSAWAGMITLAPKPNIQSMQLLMDRFFELKDCMPAKYNFLGTLLGAVGPHLLKALPGVASSIVGAFSKGQQVENKPVKTKKKKIKKEDNKIVKDVEKLTKDVAKLTTTTRRQTNATRGRRIGYRRVPGFRKPIGTYIPPNRVNYLPTNRTQNTGRLKSRLANLQPLSSLTYENSDQGRVAGRFNYN